MHFFIHFTIALISLIAIVLSCVLFTNAIEYLGNKLKLGNNATGSILAVLGTGLPETIIPLVAIFEVCFSDLKIQTAQDIALGAVLGSPFMLSTFAMFLLLIVLLLKKRNSLNVDYNFVLRDYKYFLLAYSCAILFSFKFFVNYKMFLSFVLILIYGIFVYRTIVKSRVVCIECESEELYFSHGLKLNKNFILFVQLLLSVSVLVISSHYFVDEIRYFSTVLNISPSILTLLIAPFATELPECINSVIWLKQDKDDLAIANILGAIVFQTTILCAIGMILTPWVLNRVLFINATLTMLCAIVFLLLVLKNKKITVINLLFCAFVYFLFLIYIFIC